MTLIVTGGSRGIGAAICELAASRGYDVVVNFSGDPAPAREVAERVRSHGRQALAFRADVTSEDDVRALFDAAAELGPVTALVNNAAITGNTPGRLDSYDVDIVRRSGREQQVELREGTAVPGHCARPRPVQPESAATAR